MLLKLETIKAPMKLVYEFSEFCKASPQYIADAHALTLDSSRPLLGLKGSFGLLGSAEWWANIEKGKIPLRFYSGIIQGAYAVGQNAGVEKNSIRVLLSDGSIRDFGIHVDNKADIALFQPGHLVEQVYVLDELKKQPAYDGGVNYLERPLEVAVSIKRV